jgi:hypothetical protein
MGQTTSRTLRDGVGNPVEAVKSSYLLNKVRRDTHIGTTCRHGDREGIRPRNAERETCQQIGGRRGVKCDAQYALSLRERVFNSPRRDRPRINVDGRRGRRTARDLSQ